jgi:hypothetical protein
MTENKEKNLQFQQHLWRFPCAKNLFAFVSTEKRFQQNVPGSHAARIRLNSILVIGCRAAALSVPNPTDCRRGLTVFR